ncbi:amidophosphoribosyltransferase [Erythrobacter sp. KY5]|uniref:ComF family protein n=1 Tax=Erythrobacter sp. KY5 TaxID=2011159 RepID=UPI000DBF1255|nr:ComF family protein [Erythrobacter sp. KY5]AWW74722.1 amidophosphoribosyltransferase [Erythrobacter sp. KY5]
MGWRSQLSTSLKEGLSPVVDLVYPPRCPLCGTALASQSGLCSECWSEIEVPGEPACESCQRPMGSAAASKSTCCFACAKEPPIHDGIIAASLYNDASRKLILALKHGGKISLAPLLADLIASRMPPETDNIPLLVPVPLHRWRLWSRGFNQAALLASELAKRGKGELLVDGLVRSKRTPSLGGLGIKERSDALSGAIAAQSGARPVIKGRHVILVDDVLTSGATSNACAKALMDAGAASVRVACFARVADGGISA